MNDKATLSELRRTVGIAGQLCYSVTVTYPDEAPSCVRFVGYVAGGPVVMITPRIPKGVFVRDPERFGKFGPEWVRKFFA